MTKCKCQLCKERKRMKVRKAVFATLIQGGYIQDAIGYAKKPK